MARFEIVYAPTIEQGERALKAAAARAKKKGQRDPGIANMKGWNAWRCRVCSGVGFGGLCCASCGGSFDACSPMGAR